MSNYMYYSFNMNRPKYNSISAILTYLTYMMTEEVSTDEFELSC